MRVAILGCGPSGLIAAYAAEKMGHSVTIFSRKIRSHMYGAMYLHKPIPGISNDEPELTINVTKIGTRAGYAANVYGDPNAPVSWDKFEDGPTPGWSLSKVYGYLWDRYELHIVDADLTPASIHRLAEDFDKTFSTIPIKMICENWEHSFNAIHIWVVHGKKKNARDVMIYNGLDFMGVPSWYRYSHIQGYESWEFSVQHANRWVNGVAEKLQVSEGNKPLRTDCDCHPELIRLGRFGKWDKNVFTHHGYQEVQDALL